MQEEHKPCKISPCNYKAEWYLLECPHSQDHYPLSSYSTTHPWIIENCDLHKIIVPTADPHILPLLPLFLDTNSHLTALPGDECHTFAAETGYSRKKMELLNWRLWVSRRQIPAWHFLYWQSLSCFYCLCFEVRQAPDLPQRLWWQSLPYYILWGYPWLFSNKEENTSLTRIMLRIIQALISLTGWEQNEHIVMGTQQNKKFARNVCAIPAANWDQL